MADQLEHRPRSTDPLSEFAHSAKETIGWLAEKCDQLEEELDEMKRDVKQHSAELLVIQTERKGERNRGMEWSQFILALVIALVGAIGVACAEKIIGIGAGK